MDIRWDNWLDRLYNLRRDKSGSHERPHKPVLLLSIIDPGSLRLPVRRLRRPRIARSNRLARGSGALDSICRQLK
jgi:hypothetical protein